MPSSSTAMNGPTLNVAVIVYLSTYDQHYPLRPLPHRNRKDRRIGKKLRVFFVLSGQPSCVARPYRPIWGQEDVLPCAGMKADKDPFYPLAKAVLAFGAAWDVSHLASPKGRGL